MLINEIHTLGFQIHICVKKEEKNQLFFLHGLSKKFFNITTGLNKPLQSSNHKPMFWPALNTCCVVLDIVKFECTIFFNLTYCSLILKFWEMQILFAKKNIFICFVIFNLVRGLLCLYSHVCITSLLILFKLYLLIYKLCNFIITKFCVWKSYIWNLFLYTRLLQT